MCKGGVCVRKVGKGMNWNIKACVFVHFVGGRAVAWLESRISPIPHQLVFASRSRPGSSPGVTSLKTARHIFLSSLLPFSFEPFSSGGFIIPVQWWVWSIVGSGVRWAFWIVLGQNWWNHRPSSFAVNDSHSEAIRVGRALHWTSMSLHWLHDAALKMLYWNCLFFPSIEQHWNVKANSRWNAPTPGSA